MYTLKWWVLKHDVHQMFLMQTKQKIKVKTQISWLVLQSNLSKSLPPNRKPFLLRFQLSPFAVPTVLVVLVFPPNLKVNCLQWKTLIWWITVCRVRILIVHRLFVWFFASFLHLWHGSVGFKKSKTRRENRFFPFFWNKTQQFNKTSFFISHLE